MDDDLRLLFRNYVKKQNQWVNSRVFLWISVETSLHVKPSCDGPLKFNPPTVKYISKNLYRIRMSLETCLYVTFFWNAQYLPLPKSTEKNWKKCVSSFRWRVGERLGHVVTVCAKWENNPVSHQIFFLFNQNCPWTSMWTPMDTYGHLWTPKTWHSLGLHFLLSIGVHRCPWNRFEKCNIHGWWFTTFVPKLRQKTKSVS